MRRLQHDAEREPGPKKMRGGDDLDERARQHDACAAPGLPRPGDPFGKRRGHPAHGPGDARGHAVDQLQQAPVGAQCAIAISRQRKQQQREQYETPCAGPDQSGTNAAGGIRKHHRQQCDRDQAGKYHAVGQPVERDGGQHGRKPEVLMPCNQPRPGYGTQPERHQECQQVPRHDRAKKSQRADRAQRMEQLPPLPGPNELFAGDREQHHGDESPVGAGERADEAIEVEASQHPGQRRGPEQCADPGQPSAIAASAYLRLRQSRVSI